LVNEMEIEILLETNRYLGTKETAQHVFDLLCSYNHIIPTHFGTDEPLRNTFADNKDKFVELWSSQDTFGCVIWQRNIQPKIEGMALFGKSRYPEFNKLSWTISIDSFDLIKPFLSNIMEFFGLNQFLFGYVCLKEEYYQNNILRNTPFFYNKRGEKIFHPPGSVSPILPVGLDLRKHIPGLYWLTLFGKIYVNWFGKDKIKTAPAYKIIELPKDAICLQLYEDPTLYNEQSSQEIVKSVKRHLGEKAFFDISDIDRETIAPNIDVSEITLC